MSFYTLHPPQSYLLFVGLTPSLEKIVVKNEVKVEILGFRADALLACDKSKAFAKLQKERLKMTDESIFKPGFEQSAGADSRPGILA